MLDIRDDPEYGICLFFRSDLRTKGVGWSGEYPMVTLYLTPPRITEAIQMTLPLWVDAQTPAHFRYLDEIMKGVRFRERNHEFDDTPVTFDLDEHCWKRHIDGTTFIRVPLTKFLFVLIPYLAEDGWLTLAQIPLETRAPFKEMWQSVFHTIKARRQGKRAASRELAKEPMPQPQEKNEDQNVLPFRRKITG